MILPPINHLKVRLALEEKPMLVGMLAHQNHRIYFEYNAHFLASGLQISPFHLPLRPGLRIFDPKLFEGLPGVFSDCLPDGWGRLLMDRFARSQGRLPHELTPLDRLSHMGSNAIGALIFEPCQENTKPLSFLDIQTLASQVQEVLEGESAEVLEELISLNGSSAGARPKALIGFDPQNNQIIHGNQTPSTPYEDWIVKFPNATDGDDAGAIEYVYSLMAKEAGLTMTETHLFPSDKNPGYFATKRFDRHNGERLHTHSASGLLHSDFRTPSLDYEDLLTLTAILTRDIREVEALFRMAAFNVLAHNRDDHGKNFSFLMHADGTWKVSPAYDITFSSGPYGEQSTSVMGEGKNPNIEHLQKLGLNAKIEKDKILQIIKQTQNALSQWENLAKLYNVSSDNIRLIQEKISLQ